MKMIRLENIKGIEKNEGANDTEIRETEKELKFKIPGELEEVLRESNGFSCDSGVLVYGTSEIAERNMNYEVEEYAPGYLAIGDDGGDYVFLISQEEGEKKILAVDCGDMNPEDSEIVSHSLKEWIESGCAFE